MVGMRLSEFQRAVSDEFGSGYGPVLVADLVLGELGGRTCAQALKDGTPAREVWLALCRAQDVPRARWNGAGVPEPRV
ncbi:DUF3046 domain-containing protein [Clavibacter michiganensis subsp. insidiosus]|uniref:DUF3046 domain-containing protein n=2 Tax=Clavibacter michiganensis subsp. insidiosus TaxID=33014 RepID=A0A399N1C9_9MICO|nr:signal transduction histidine kinase [Clavibacter michiganensis subsp. insidiosus]AWG01838.1 signal transduction histidine kinase [Clavibacter michiganensis subsp. insidiosus]OQJ59655.1 signal transduction histidine kinase [Clavibacter michiganensis subsp. insidiosus]RII86756.1 DUF3046 domain-containing protein [Clavibacter michiganensis subsp. insidiosus]RIJ44257.1 DUF3046 domain-containing protein [Clavibacter michiganensis subsp. insidiosus]